MELNQLWQVLRWVQLGGSLGCLQREETCFRSCFDLVPSSLSQLSGCSPWASALFHLDPSSLPGPKPMSQLLLCWTFVLCPDPKHCGLYLTPYSCREPWWAPPSLPAVSYWLCQSSIFHSPSVGIQFPLPHHRLKSCCPSTPPHTVSALVKSDEPTVRSQKGAFPLVRTPQEVHKCLLAWEQPHTSCQFISFQNVVRIHHLFKELT